MPSESTKTYVVSLGGSLVAPKGGPNVEFLSKFRSIIKFELARGNKFYIIVGGGYPARQYQQALEELGADEKTLDHVGIFTTHMNAYYVSLAFDFSPEHKVVLKVEKLLGDADLHITGAGLEPGQSSDTVAVKTALKIGADTVINLSNIKQVYTADPDTNPDATTIDRLSWGDYLKIIPNEWHPGLSTPFDPVASNLASDMGVEVVVLGSDLENFQRYIAGSDYLGTLISNKHDQT